MRYYQRGGNCGRWNYINSNVGKIPQNNRKVVDCMLPCLYSNRVFPTIRMSQASMTYSYFGFSCKALCPKNRSQTTLLPNAHIRNRIPTKNNLWRRKSKYKLFYFLCSNWTTCEIEMRGLRVVWYEWLLAPDPGQPITFKSWLTKTFGISENYQLAIFYFVDTSYIKEHSL